MASDASSAEPRDSWLPMPWTLLAWILAAGLSGLALLVLIGRPTTALPRRIKRQSPPNSQANRPESPQKTRLAPRIGADGRRIGRDLWKFPAGECIVEHYPNDRTPTAGFAELRQEDFGEVAFHPKDCWYVGQDEGYCAATFNCGTFAVHDFVDLSPEDWVSMTPTFDGHATPIAVIIDSYCQRVRTFSLTEAIVNGAFEADGTLRDGDVVAFERTLTSPDKTRRVFTHLGLVKKVDGVNRLLSKFGRGPVALSNLNFPHRMYPGAEVVNVYRVREQAL
jgi:hypothetical protein